MSARRSIAAECRLRPAKAVDRLDLNDIPNLVSERPDRLWNISALLTLERGPLVRLDGKLDVERIGLAIEARIATIPRLRQRLRRPAFGLYTRCPRPAPSNSFLEHHRQSAQLRSRSQQVVSGVRAMGSRSRVHNWFVGSSADGESLCHKCRRPSLAGPNSRLASAGRHPNPAAWRQYSHRRGCSFLRRGRLFVLEVDPYLIPESELFLTGLAASIYDLTGARVEMGKHALSVGRSQGGTTSPGRLARPPGDTAI